MQFLRSPHQHFSRPRRLLASASSSSSLCCIASSIFHSRARCASSPSSSSAAASVAAPATSSSSEQSAPATATTATATTITHPFLNYNVTFILSQIDYCATLAQEANAKHGVPLNIPPQANPSTDKHQLVYCEKLAERVMDPSQFAYPMIHEAPPKTVPGMEIVKVERLPTTATAPSATTATGGKNPLFSEFPNPLKALVQSMSVDDGGASAIVFPLPNDDEIDTLVVDTWDTVAERRIKENPDFEKVYRRSTSFVVMSTDDKATASHELKKSEAVLSDTADGAQAVHFRTPFTQEVSDAQPPSPTKGLERKFACGECGKSFRLLDAVVNHYQMAHKMIIPQDKLLEFKKLDNPLLARDIENFRKRQELAERRKREVEEQAQMNKERQQKQDMMIAQQQQQVLDDAAAAAAGPNGTLVVGEAALRATPLPEVDISVHARSAVNAVLLGAVREVRTGYVGNNFVLQLQVETFFDDDNDQQQQERQLHLVRCFGEQYASTASTIVRDGARVLVHGTFKTNRHFDRLSGAVQAFPYVKVVAPFGSLQVVLS